MEADHHEVINLCVVLTVTADCTFVLWFNEDLHTYQSHNQNSERSMPSRTTWSIPLGQEMAMFGPLKGHMNYTAKGVHIA